MKFVAISGSHRSIDKAQSFKITNWLSEALSNRKTPVDTDVISLSDNPFPLWDEAAWDSSSILSHSK